MGLSIVGLNVKSLQASYTSVFDIAGILTQG